MERNNRISPIFQNRVQDPSSPGDGWANSVLGILSSRRDWRGHVQNAIGVELHGVVECIGLLGVEL